MSADTPAAAAADTATDTPWPGSWRVALDRTLQLHVPARLGSLTTYVLLEQERWFEHEFGFVQRLVDPDAWALDIGADHGVYALALARHLPGGRVIAFEPTREPRARLMRSILDNGLADRVAVAPLGLSDVARDAEIDAGTGGPPDTRLGGSPCRETVRLERLDDFLARHAAGQAIGFVRLDAQRDLQPLLRGGEAFLRSQSPVVMFKPVAGDRAAGDLVQRFEDLGYRVWQHLPGLDLLAPVHRESLATEGPPNLFAIRPDRARGLAARGLLASDFGDGGVHDILSLEEGRAVRAWLRTLPCVAAAATDDDVDPGRDLLASVHADPGLGPEVRLARVHAALRWLQHDMASAAGVVPATVSAAIHALHLLGRRQAAVQLALKSLDHWPRRTTPPGLFLPPQASDLGRGRSADAASWLQLAIGEFVERWRADSSYFAPADPSSLRRLLLHPDHGVEIERRYALGEFRQNRVPDADLLPHLRVGADTGNPAIWRAVLDPAMAAGVH